MGSVISQEKPIESGLKSNSNKSIVARQYSLKQAFSGEMEETGGQKKIDANKDGKISGDDFKILKAKNNKMKGGGIAIRGTNFKGIY